MAATSVLAAVMALAGVTPAVAAGSSAGTGVPSQAPAAEVAKALGANEIPAALVVLVDISQSMSHGLYQRVRQVVPRFVGALATQSPRDQVAVIAFGARRDTRVVQPLARPTRDINLPPTADSRGTDLGYAFQLALNVLGHAEGMQEGGVLLLSDGKLNALHDSAYNGYGAPGWKALHKTLKGLSMQVTGYDLPLTDNPADFGDQYAALGHVFGSDRQQIQPDLTNLGAQLRQAVSRGVIGRKVTARVQPDIGEGVRVAWNVPGVAGSSPLNLRTGSADGQVTLTATTTRVPLDVTGLSVSITGLPREVTATLPGNSGVIRPHASVTLPVHLTWLRASSADLGAGPPPWPGRLALSGQVGSTFSNAITNYYGDTNFHVGGLTGAASAALTTTYSPPSPIVIVLVILLLVLLVVLAVGAYYFSLLDGTLTLTTVDDVSLESLLLPARPQVKAGTESLIGIPGTITVRRRLLGNRMQVRLKLARFPEASGPLSDGGRTMLAGIDIVHDPDPVPRRRIRLPAGMTR
jgi:hypothetical protein